MALIAGRALADRMQSPLKIGGSAAGTPQLVFDIGSGSSNPVIESSSGSLALSNNGSSFVGVPTANDTFAVLNATQTLTNKTLTSPTITTPSLTSPTVTSGGISNVGGGTAASQFYKTAIFSNALASAGVDTLAPSGATQILGAFGFGQQGNGTTWSVVDPAACSGSEFCFQSVAGITTVKIKNNAGQTGTYFAVVFYQ